MNVSVLMTIYNRSKLLNRSLPSVIKQLETNDEIIVVDDGSTDNVMEIVEKYRKNFLNIHYFRREKSGYNNGAIPKNIALKKSKNELIIISDPEVIHLTGCIKQIKSYIKNNDRLFITVGTMFFVGDKFQPKIESGEYDLVEYVKNHKGIPVREGNGWFDEQKNVWMMKDQLAPFIGGIKREHLMAIGGWDERFNQFWGHDDTDVQTRLRIYGIRQITDNAIMGIHQYHSRPTPQSMVGVDSVNLEIVKEHHYKNKYLANEGIEWGKL